MGPHGSGTYWPPDAARPLAQREAALASARHSAAGMSGSPHLVGLLLALLGIASLVGALLFLARPEDDRAEPAGRTWQDAGAEDEETR